MGDAVIRSVIMEAVGRSISERADLLDICRAAGATTKQFTKVLNALVESNGVTRGRRPSRVKNRPFAYTYHPAVSMEGLSPEQAMERARLAMGEIGGGS